MLIKHADDTLVGTRGSTVTISPTKTPIRYGFTFKYWATTPEDVPPFYAENDPLILTDSMILYAIWHDDSDLPHYTMVTGSAFNSAIASRNPSSIVFCPTAPAGATRINGNYDAANQGDIKLYYSGSTVYVECAGIIDLNTDSSGMFANLGNLASIVIEDNCGVATNRVEYFNNFFKGTILSSAPDFIESLDFTSAVDTSGMFYGTRFTSLSLPGAKTHEVLDMNSMFKNMTYLTSIDLTGWDVSNIGLYTFDYNKGLAEMFSGCSALTSIDLSSWFGTETIVSMKRMFYGCTSIQEIDLTGWTPFYAKSSVEMFRGCSSLTTIYATSDFNIEGVTEDTDMFTGCTNLVGGNGTAFATTQNLYASTKRYAQVDAEGSTGYFTSGTVVVTYDANGGNPGVITSVVIHRVTPYYSNIKSVPSREDYMFMGWGLHDDDTAADALPYIASATDVTVYAIWEPIVYYNLAPGTVVNLALKSVNNEAPSNTRPNTVTFVREVPTGAVLSTYNAGDLSADSSGGILMYYNPAETISKFDIYIVSSGVIRFNSNSSYMFSSCTGLQSVANDGATIDTSGVTTFAGMFENCPSTMEKRIASDFDISSAVELW